MSVINNLRLSQKLLMAVELRSELKQGIDEEELAGRIAVDTGVLLERDESETEDLSFSEGDVVPATIKVAVFALDIDHEDAKNEPYGLKELRKSGATRYLFNCEFRLHFDVTKSFKVRSDHFETNAQDLLSFAYDDIRQIMDLLTNQTPYKGITLPPDHRQIIRSSD